MAALWDLPGNESFINNIEPQGTGGEGWQSSVGTRNARSERSEHLTQTSSK